jgi:hypothetical protein
VKNVTKATPHDIPRPNQLVDPVHITNHPSQLASIGVYFLFFYDTDLSSGKGYNWEAGLDDLDLSIVLSGIRPMTLTT